jgi:hypothetical protein
MKKVRYLAAAAGLVPAAAGLAAPAAATAATAHAPQAPLASRPAKAVSVHHLQAAPAAGCTGTKRFDFSTKNNPRLRGHGWYTTEVPDGVYCIGTVDISMKYNKTLSKAAYVRINPGDPFNSAAMTTGLTKEKAGTWLKRSFGFHREFTGTVVGLSLFSYPYGDNHASFDHATVTGP